MILNHTYLSWVINSTKTEWRHDSADLAELKVGLAPDGMDTKEFVAYGATQRTLSQFREAGWKLLEGCK